MQSLPKLAELGLDLLRISPLRRWLTLALPFGWAALFIIAAVNGLWAVAIGCLICLSFCTYGSISHDLVHRTLGLSRRSNDLFLALVELLAIRSGHAYRAAHLHHHRRFPHDDDIEGAACRMSLLGSLVDGLTLQVRMYRWALRHAPSDRGWIAAEGAGCLAIIVGSSALAPVTLVPLTYVTLMIAGSWIIPLITAYIPHDVSGTTPLEQTRRFRGTVASIVALEHLYHLEHHLYPAVPHHNWPALARRLDPYFDAMNVKPIRLWF